MSYKIQRNNVVGHGDIQPSISDRWELVFTARRYGVAWLVMCLPYKHRNLSLIPGSPTEMLGRVAYICNIPVAHWPASVE